MRLTSTRWPISSVGTIDSLGIRYGLTRNAWMPSARPSATATMTTSSTRELAGSFSAGFAPHDRRSASRRRPRGVARRPRPSGVGASSASASASAAPRVGGSSAASAPSASGLAPRRPSPRPDALGVAASLGRAASASSWLGGRRQQAAARGPLGAGVPALAHAGALADPVAEVVELRAADVTAGGDLDLLDLRGVHAGTCAPRRRRTTACGP